MLVKLAFPVSIASYHDVDMIKCVNTTECILPRPLKRNLSPLPEDKECSNSELKKSCKLKKRKQRKQCLKLPSLPEYDEY